MTRYREIRVMTRDELDGVSGGNPGAVNSPGNLPLAGSDSDPYGARTVTMFLRRVWREGALFGRTPAG